MVDLHERVASLRAERCASLERLVARLGASGAASVPTGAFVGAFCAVWQGPEGRYRIQADGRVLMPDGRVLPWDEALAGR